jgi:hypothetical protein
MNKLLFVSALLLGLSNSSFCQLDIQTIAEQSDYKSTSTHKDVLSFIDRIKKASPHVRVETIAKTVQGREIPLVVIANPMPKTPADLASDSRVVVYVQANIHSGEVEGKEASLMYMRDLLRQKNPELLKHVIMLFCPNLNADGNDRISRENRTNQNGPVNGVGVRHNALYLDMNRDAMKLETEEMRGVIKNVLNRWDPQVIMDCHTTNGSYHEEVVTFTWMMNPNGDRGLINYMRDKMMPSVSGILRDKYQTDNCFYGEFVDQANYNLGWVSYAAEPRYFTNYLGLRNRLSILNENYVYADYKSRVVGCYNLINALMDYCGANRVEIKRMVAEADSRTIARGLNPTPIDSFAITYQGQPTPAMVTIKSWEVEPIPNAQGWNRFRKTDRKKTVTVPYIADYYPTKSVRLPFAYILTVDDPLVLNLLRLHGVAIEQLKDTVTLSVERFEIEEMKPQPRLNQGHYTNSVKGRFVPERKRFEAGQYIVRTSQKLGYLASYLLEPQADDGLLLWNFFDRYLVPQWGRGYYPYPVYRVMEKGNL